MNRFFRVLTLATVLALLLGTGLAAANGPIDPSEVEAELHPNESIKVKKSVTTASIPPVVDIFLLEDETGSFWDDIITLKALAPAIWDAIAGAGVDFTMGVGGFRDFDQDGWGSPGDWVYKRHQDLTTTKANFIAGVSALTASGGADGPEAQLEALHYLAVPTHPAIDSNGDGDTTDPNDTPTGRQPTWRPGAQRVVLLATDASCHVTGDPVAWGPPIPGGWPGDAGTASAAVTAGILNSAGIIVIGLTPGGAGTIGCVDTLAAGTGGSVHATKATGEDIKKAILAGLKELTTDVWWETDCGPELEVSLEPKVRDDVPGDTTVTFEETIKVANDALPGEYCCTVTFFANEYPEQGEEIGRQEICITVLDGRLTGGGSIPSDEYKRVTHGFELHCASALGPNNLQVNWGKGNKFHLESLGSATCSDDPNIDERPPVAGFDTYVGSGTGRYNGVSGATIEFTFTDAGEPGKSDFANIVITDASGVVLNVSGNLKNGNHQAHAQ